VLARLLAQHACSTLMLMGMSINDPSVFSPVSLKACDDLITVRVGQEGH
jgi:hypothetical protein